MIGGFSQILIYIFYLRLILRIKLITLNIRFWRLYSFWDKQSRRNNNYVNMCSTHRNSIILKLHWCMTFMRSTKYEFGWVIRYTKLYKRHQYKIKLSDNFRASVQFCFDARSMTTFPSASMMDDQCHHHVVFTNFIFRNEDFSLRRKQRNKCIDISCHKLAYFSKFPATNSSFFAILMAGL